MSLYNINGIEYIVQILKQEGIEWLACLRSRKSLKWSQPYKEAQRLNAEGQTVLIDVQANMEG